jgi:hypothetical protein
MASRTVFQVSIEDRYTRYGIESLLLHLYEYPITVNDDYTITGTRATDSVGDPISGVEQGDGQYAFTDIEYGEYVIVAYKPGLRPQIVNGYSRFMILPKLSANEIACSETDTTDLKTKLNTVIQYVLDNNGGWIGTPPTLIT